MVLKQLGCYLFLHLSLNSFVLIGNQKSTLDVTPERPNVVFHLSQDLPNVTDQSTFENGIYANLTKDEFWLRLVQLSMDKWNQVSGSYVRLTLSTDRTSSLDNNDKRNSILKTTTLAASLAAVAIPEIDNASGTIVDCDIQIGSGAQTASVMGYVLMHELGHCLGIGHNHINQKAAMGYTRSNRSLDLGLDDKAAVIYLYPSPEYDTELNEFAPCGVITAEGKTYSLVYDFLWFTLPIVLVFLKRKRNSFS